MVSEGGADGVTKKAEALAAGRASLEDGVTGNRSGQPKKENCLTSLLKQEMSEICPADREKRTKLIVRAMLQRAMKGNAAALREVWERIDGKVLQSGRVELGAEGQSVKISVTYEDEIKTRGRKGRKKAGS